MTETEKKAKVKARAKKPPPRKRRAHRKAAADDLVGIRREGGGYRLPAFPLEAWFVARSIPGERRAGFRATVLEEDGGRLVSRSLEVWDERFSRYCGAAC